MQAMTLIKIPNGNRYVPGGKTIKHRTEFDFCVGLEGNAIFFDAKSTSTPINLKDKIFSARKIHQFTALMEAHRAGNIAGYLIHFRKPGIIAWANVVLINNLNRLGQKSLTHDTKGLVCQEDSVPISFRDLWKNDLRRRGI